MDKRIALCVFYIAGERTEIELRRYDDSRLSLTGVFEGGCGQCLDRIAEAADAANYAGDDLSEIMTIWREHHLKPTPDSVFDRCAAVMTELSGQRLGDAPDLDDAPDIGGELFDSLDVIKRLEAYRQAVAFMGVPEDKLDSMNNAEAWPEELHDATDDQREIAEEFIKLREFNDEGESYASDWHYGTVIIREDHFTEYAEQMVKDIGDMPDETPGYIAIDWEKTAENIKVDYTEIEYAGTSYLVR